MESGRENIVIRQVPPFTAAALRCGGRTDPECRAHDRENFPLYIFNIYNIIII